MTNNEQLPPSLLHRPTLESGTPIIRRKFGKWRSLFIQAFASQFGPHNEEDQDAVEAILVRESESVKPLINESGRASLHYKRSLALQLEYSHFKNRDAGVIYQTSALRNIFQGHPPHKHNSAFSCDELLSHWSFISPRHSSCEIGQNTVKTVRTKVEENDKVADWMCRIARELVNNVDSSSMQLISLVEQPNREDVVGFFSFWRYTAATLRGRLHILHLFPTWLLEILVAHCWNINLTPWWSASSPESAQVRPRPPILPSKRALDTSTPQDLPGGVVYWGKHKKQPGNLDPTRGDNEIFLIWQDTCATYTSDIGVYIWEPQNSIPTSQYAKIIVSFSKNDADCEIVRLVLAFGSCRAHTLFTKKRDATHWSPMRELILSLCCVFEVLIMDTWECISKCHDESNRIHRIRHDLEVFDHFTHWMNQSDRSRHVSASLLNRLDILQKDMEFLEEELKKLQVTLEENQKIMRNHFQLEQDLRVFRITILAAVFLPLSFTTSLFGMNLDSSVSEGPIGFSSFTNSTLEGISTDLRDSTQALVSIISSSSNLSFSWKTFGITAGALILTLPLSLFVGAVVRFIVVWAKDHIVYWRVIAIAGAVTFAFFSIAGLYFVNDGAVLLYILTNVFLTLAFIWRAYWGWRLNDRPLIWTSLAALTITSFFGSGLDSLPLSLHSLSLVMCIITMGGTPLASNP
ncbi:hypothetical protein EV127DRAFT_474068 [Xylaria flabelliformis]|nr:hypothetical protein EV127DRAFT_474068 [Xylaria flabelliformis]